jgi:tRNA-splicing ligase RtcB
MKVIHEQGSRPIKAWVGEKDMPARVWADEERTQMVETTTRALDIEDSALTQLKNLARLPFIASNGVAVMPDVHAGIGSTVGTVIATDKAIIPAAVGVDIGCGMNAVRLSLKASDLPDSLKDIRESIEAAVPMGARRFHRRQDADAGLLRAGRE